MFGKGTKATTKIKWDTSSDTYHGKASMPILIDYSDGYLEVSGLDGSRFWSGPLADAHADLRKIVKGLPKGNPKRNPKRSKAPKKKSGLRGLTLI